MSKPNRSLSGWVVSIIMMVSWLLSKRLSGFLGGGKGRGVALRDEVLDDVLDGEIEEMCCEKCGLDYSWDSLFCQQCGADLRRITDTPTPQAQNNGRTVVFCLLLIFGGIATLHAWNFNGLRHSAFHIGLAQVGVLLGWLAIAFIRTNSWGYFGIVLLSLFMNVQLCHALAQKVTTNHMRLENLFHVFTLCVAAAPLFALIIVSVAHNRIDSFEALVTRRRFRYIFAGTAIIIVSFLGINYIDLLSNSNSVASVDKPSLKSVSQRDFFSSLESLMDPRSMQQQELSYREVNYVQDARHIDFLEDVYVESYLSKQQLAALAKDGARDPSWSKRDVTVVYWIWHGIINHEQNFRFDRYTHSTFDDLSKYVVKIPNPEVLNYPYRSSNPHASPAMRVNYSNIQTTTFEEVVLPNGIRYIDELMGNGEVAVSGKRVTMHYTGTLPNDAEFDSSVGGEPFSFTLGAHHVIQGLDIGMVGMRVGGKRKISIPPDQAYGETGSGVIGPNTTLLFVVELLRIE